ncbi:MAG: hypothetical protein EWV70_09500 [Microcystis flos-aquae Mf_QC_C_20070823_S20]|nr:MAG: hypothetical protein EWV70_09500 [Microcystis flos-aquae Mf_QC_C_20070823_S20]
MARQAPPDIGRPTPIQPVATPVSTYVRPPDPAPSNLHQLAQGMAVLDSGLKSWLQKREAEQAKADAIRGEAAFYRDNAAGMAESVRRGETPAHQSPIFMQSWKKAQGHQMGIEMRSQFAQEYAQWEGRNSEDPTAFPTFLEDFVSRHITTDDADVLTGLMPHVEALTESAQTTYSTDRANTVYNGSINTRAAIVGDIIDHASQQGIALEAGTNYEGMKADILDQREEALSVGIRMADFDKQLVETIAAKAIEHGDPNLLGILEDSLPGYEVKLSSLPDFRDVKATTIAALTLEARRQGEAEAKRQAAYDKAREGQIVSNVYKALSESPGAEVPEEVLTEWEKHDPEARKKLVDARKSLTDGLTLEDPDDLITIERMIQSGSGKDDIFELAASGVIKDPATFKALLDRVEQREQVAASILSTQTTKRYLTTIKERTTLVGPDAMFAPDGLTDEGIEATSYFEQMLIEWRIAHPEATLFEQDQFVKQAADLVLGRIKEGDAGEQPQFMSVEDEERIRAEEEMLRAEEDAKRQALIDGFLGLNEGEDSGPSTNPVAGPNRPATLGDFVGAAPGQLYEEFRNDTYGQALPPTLSTLGEASQQIVRNQAELMGVSPEDYVLETWKVVREGLGLSTEYTPPAPAPDTLDLSNARSPEAASQAVAYFQSSPEAVRIDPSLIQDHTPTTSGNWNFGKLSEPSALVIHHTAGRGGVDGVIQTFKDRNFPAHFVIDRDGAIHRILADDQKGQHTKPAQDGSDISNSNSWGVEIIANDDSDLTPAQVQASVQLAYYLHDNYGMPLDRVVGHGQINDHKQETEGATVLAALGALSAGGNPNANMGIATSPASSRSGVVDNLLAFIAQEEGTGGSYNMVYGGREQPLTDMSIAQVRGIGKAAGKYQMMPDTLGDAQRALGLSPDTKFTPEVQEQIVQWLLQRRGLKEWQAGQMTTERFVDNLAMEWAALSTSSGKANYDGQGANASLPKLLAALGQ